MIDRYLSRNKLHPSTRDTLQSLEELQDAITIFEQEKVANFMRRAVDKDATAPTGAKPYCLILAECIETAHKDGLEIWESVEILAFQSHAYVNLQDQRAAAETERQAVVQIERRIAAERAFGESLENLKLDDSTFEALLESEKI